MKSIYLNAGKINDVFNDLKQNFKGTLTINNDEHHLEFGFDLAKGNIKGMTFPDGLTYMQFDMVFYDDARLSMESLNTSPIYFAYCSEGAIEHGFGEQGERKIIKKQQSGILKRTSSVNSVLYFKKQVPIKFCIVQIGTKDTVAVERNEELVKKLKNTFFITKEDYLKVSYQSNEIIQKMEELNTLPQKGFVRDVFIGRMLEKILEMEIEQHSHGYAVMANSIRSFTSKQIDNIQKTSSFVADSWLELFTTDHLIQKAGLFLNKLQSDFKIVRNRSVHQLLLFMRIERNSI